MNDSFDWTHPNIEVELLGTRNALPSTAHARDIERADGADAEDVEDGRTLDDLLAEEGYEPPAAPAIVKAPPVAPRPTLAGDPATSGPYHTDPFSDDADDAEWEWDGGDWDGGDWDAGVGFTAMPSAAEALAALAGDEPAHADGALAVEPSPPAALPAVSGGEFEAAGRRRRNDEPLPSDDIAPETVDALDEPAALHAELGLEPESVKLPTAAVPAPDADTETEPAPVVEQAHAESAEDAERAGPPHPTALAVAFEARPKSHPAIALNSEATDDMRRVNHVYATADRVLTEGQAVDILLSRRPFPEATAKLDAAQEAMSKEEGGELPDFSGSRSGGGSALVSWLASRLGRLMNAKALGFLALYAALVFVGMYVGLASKTALVVGLVVSAGLAFDFVDFQRGRGGKSSGKPADPNRRRALTAFQKRELKAVSHKALDSPHFEVALRVVVSDEANAEQLFAQLAALRVCDGDEAVDREIAQVEQRIGALRGELRNKAVEITRAYFNFQDELQGLDWVETDAADAAQCIMGLDTPERPLVLGRSEIGALFHAPDDETVKAVDAVRLNFKQLPIGRPLLIEDPKNPPKGGEYGKGLIPLGLLNPGTKDEVSFGMRVDDLDKHCYMSGRTGSGKSETLKWLIFGCAKAGYPIVVIDPHGQLADDVLAMLAMNVPERADDLLLVDLSNADNPVALNMLDVRSADEVEGVVQSVIDVLATQMQLGAGAPRAVNLATQGLTALCEANLHIADPSKKITLLQLVTFFTDAEFRRLVLEFCTNPTVTEAFDPERGPFEQLSEKQQSEMAMPIIRAIQPLGNSPSFAAVFSAGENRLDFGKLINDGKIILVKLARFSRQKKIGEMIGALIVPWIMGNVEAFGRRDDPDNPGRKIGAGCRVFVDEAQALIGATSPVPELLAECRKFDLGLVAANQYLSQMPKNVVDAMLANTASKIALPLDPSSSQLMANSISPNDKKVSGGDIAVLDNFHYYGNVLLPTGERQGNHFLTGGSGAFSAKCMPLIGGKPTTESNATVARAKQRSYELVCNEREEILAKRQTLVADIKTVLSELWHERAGEPEDPAPGDADFGFDAGGAAGEDWTGW